MRIRSPQRLASLFDLETPERCLTKKVREKMIDTSRTYKKLVFECLTCGFPFTREDLGRCPVCKGPVATFAILDKYYPEFSGSFVRIVLEEDQEWYWNGGDVLVKNITRRAMSLSGKGCGIQSPHIDLKSEHGRLFFEAASQIDGWDGYPVVMQEFLCIGTVYGVD